MHTCTCIYCTYYIDASQTNILRLAGGTALYNGVVEWKRPGASAWTPFAYDGWSNAHSEVACRALGFSNVSGAYYSVSGQRLTPSTCISRLTCSGSEGTFGDCTGPGVNFHCALDLVGIRCAGPLEAFTLATTAPSASPSTPPAGNGIYVLLQWFVLQSMQVPCLKQLPS